MSATILPFPRLFGRAMSTARPLAALLAPFTGAWRDEHVPLIDAALSLLQADDVELLRRCRLIAEAEGPAMLDHITAQLDQLAAHLADVVEALSITAMRIRAAMVRISQ